MAVTIQDRALEAATARTKAEAHLKAAAHALDDMQAAEADARIIRDDVLADLAHRLDAMADDDTIEQAQIALDLATITDDYKASAVALDRAEDDLADAEVALTAAVNEAAKYPFPAPEPGPED